MGMWQIYCTLCGCPTNVDVVGAGTEHVWMDKSRVVSQCGTYTEVGKYNMYGDVTIAGKDMVYEFSDNPIDDPDSPTMYLVHDSCWKVCNYPIVFTSSAPTDLTDYQEQFFGGFVTEDEDGELPPSWMLLDPLTNKKNRDRIVSQLTATQVLTIPQK